MQIKTILSEAKKEIDALDAELLLAFVLKQERSYLMSHTKHELSSKQEKEFRQLWQRRKKHEPFAYLVGKKEFYGLQFKVNPNVLIPRPLSEKIIDLVLKKAKSKSTIVDIGTGSGCLAITLAKRGFQKIIALDISPEALQIAQENAQRHEVQIKFIESDLLENLPKIKPPLILVANLPYIPEGDRLMLDVFNFEPHIALFAGKDGLDFYRRLFAQLSDFDLMILECDTRQKEGLQKLCAKYCPRKNIQFWENDRIVVISS